jgi:ABC-type multidrug transport system ATPase subunit
MPEEWRLAFVPTMLHHFLLPWYTAEQNVSFYASGGRHLSSPFIKGLASEWAELLGRKDATNLLKRPVYELSTGERAVLALLCSLASKPNVVLLDELFANASISTANRMLARLEAFRDAGGLIIFTTHQQSIADRLASQFINLESDEMVTA